MTTLFLYHVNCTPYKSFFVINQIADFTYIDPRLEKSREPLCTIDMFAKARSQAVN